MKPMKWSWWALAVAALVLTACSRDVGECWLPSEDGQGAAGGGPVVPIGAGGFGDVPPDPQNAENPPSCDVDDDPTPLGELVCAPSNWGGNCHASCLSYGALCYPVVENYITKRQNVLWKCCNCNPGKCWYIDRTDSTSGCKIPTGAEPPVKNCW